METASRASTTDGETSDPSSLIKPRTKTKLRRVQSSEGSVVLLQPQGEQSSDPSCQFKDWRKERAVYRSSGVGKDYSKEELQLQGWLPEKTL